MSNFISRCLYHVSDQPLVPEAFQEVSTQYYHNTTLLNFEVKLRLAFIQRCRRHISHAIDVPCTPLSCHYISMKEFFENGSNFLRTNLSHHLFPPEMLDQLIPNIIDQTRSWHNNNHNNLPCRFEDGFVAIPLAIEIIVELHENVILEDVVDYIEEIKMTPTSEEVVRLLDKTKFQEGIETKEKRDCCICLDDICDNVDVSVLPCQHVFHHNCIVRWLKTSHLCPLCRYPLPVCT